MTEPFLQKDASEPMLTLMREVMRFDQSDPLRASDDNRKLELTADLGALPMDAGLVKWMRNAFRD